MKIRVYSVKSCPNCKILKEFLTAEGITYEEVDMTTVDALTELRFHQIFSLVAPILQVGSTFLTYKDLFHNNNKEKLEQEKIKSIYTAQSKESP